MANGLVEFNLHNGDNCWGMTISESASSKIASFEIVISERARQKAISDRALHPLGDTLPYSQADVDGSLLERFGRIVQAYPARPALVDGDSHYTYRQLDQRANQLAHAILDRCGPGSEPVAVALGIEVDWVVAAVAIWKAGKYYVTLDPGHPAERLKLICEDAQVRLIVTNANRQEFAAILAGDTTNVVVIESATHTWSITPPLVTVDPLSPACIVYTSGSTGRPKGVLQIHRHVVAMVLERGVAVHLGPYDRASLLISGGMSGAIYSTACALLSGSAIYPFRFQEEGLVRFEQWLLDQSITVLWSGAIARTWLLTLDGSRQFPDLRVVGLGAAPVYREHVVAYQRYLADHCILYNVYSSTEVRSVAIYLMDKATQLTTRQVPVGYAPVWGEIQIWDDADQPVPPGEVGEIVIFSPHIPPGYWQRPELTAARFGMDAAGRPYCRMGDLGRLDDAGLLWVLGRRDGQIKIRAFRVETAEVEVALLELPGVQQAFVFARGLEDSDRYLVAYVAAGERAAQVGGAELRGQLRQRLPNYMIPTQIVVMESLPRNVNGKIDRVALQARELPSLPNDPSAVATSATEQGVAEMVRELLGGSGIDSVIGSHDNFFEVGGHSLLAARLLLRIQRTYGIELPPRTFFEAPTIAGLAAHIDQAAQPGGKGPERVHSEGIGVVLVLAGDPALRPFFLMPGGGGSLLELLWYQELLQRLPANQPLYALLTQANAAADKSYNTVGELVMDAVAAIRHVQPNGPYLLGGECIGGKLIYEVARVLASEGEEVALLALLDTALEGYARQAARSRPNRWFRKVLYHATHVRRLGWPAGARHLWERASLLVPANVFANARVRDAQRLRSQYRRLLNEYRPQEPYGGHLVLIRSQETAPATTWQQLVFSLDEYVVAGTHQTYLSSAVAETARHLSGALARAQATVLPATHPESTLQPALDAGRHGAPAHQEIVGLDA